MKNIFYTLLILLNFQAFGMHNKEMTFNGQKIMHLSFHQTEDALWYEATLENHDLIRATLYPVENTYHCTLDAIEPTKSQKKSLLNFQGCQSFLLPDNTFKQLKDLYTKTQGK